MSKVQELKNADYKAYAEVLRLEAIIEVIKREFPNEASSILRDVTRVNV